MLIYVDLRRDIHCFLTPNEISTLEAKLLKGRILEFGNPNKWYPLEISIKEDECNEGINVKRRYDKHETRFVYLSKKPYTELLEHGLTSALYFDGKWFGRLLVWDETRVKDLNLMEAAWLGQFKFSEGYK